MSSIRVSGNTSGYYDLTVPDIAGNNTLPINQIVAADSSGNVGIGVTPSAWSTFNALEMSNGVYLGSYTGGTTAGYLGTNNYFNGSNFIYKNSDFATRYQQVDGIHQFFTAPSGTAGNSISFTEAMRIDSSGNVGVDTDSPDAKLHVNGASTRVQVSDTGTSFTAQDFLSNSNAVRATIGVERSSGGGLFVGSSAYAAVFGTASNGATQFATNNNIRMTIDSSGRLTVSSIGTDTTLSGGQPGLQVTGSGFNGYMAAVRRDSSVYSSGLLLAKSRNSTADNFTVLQDNDKIGSIIFIGDDGSIPINVDTRTFSFNTNESKTILFKRFRTSIG